MLDVFYIFLEPQIGTYWYFTLVVIMFSYTEYYWLLDSP